MLLGDCPDKGAHHLAGGYPDDWKPCASWLSRPAAGANVCTRRHCQLRVVRCALRLIPDGMGATGGVQRFHSMSRLVKICWPFLEYFGDCKSPRSWTRRIWALKLRQGGWGSRGRKNETSGPATRRDGGRAGARRRGPAGGRKKRGRAQEAVCTALGGMGPQVLIGGAYMFAGFAMAAPVAAFWER